MTSLYIAIVKILQLARFYQKRNERYASVVESVVGSSPRGERLMVDVGCGPGGITALLRGFIVVGLDSDRYYLSHFIEPKIPRIQARAEHLPLRAMSVDVVLAISLVEHVAEQPALFVELARVLKEGGQLVLQVPELRFPIEPHTKWPLLHVWNQSLQGRILAATGYQDLNMTTSLSGIKRFAEAAGLRSHRLIPLWHFPLARIAGLPMGYFISFNKAA